MLLLLKSGYVFVHCELLNFSDLQSLHLAIREESLQPLLTFLYLFPSVLYCPK